VQTVDSEESGDELEFVEACAGGMAALEESSPFFVEDTESEGIELVKGTGKEGSSKNKLGKEKVKEVFSKVSKVTAKEGFGKGKLVKGKVKDNRQGKDSGTAEVEKPGKRKPSSKSRRALRVLLRLSSVCIALSWVQTRGGPHEVSPGGGTARRPFQRHVRLPR
jgi:hypothetical protein